MVAVPWFIGGSDTETVLHPAEVARLLAYGAFNGREGIVGPTDLEVRELATPGSQVRAFPGSCLILARHLGGDYQAYADYMPTEDQVDVAATDSTGGRTDLVIRRVENPYAAGESWTLPADPANGPYIFNRVVPNIGQYVSYDPTLVRSVHELGQGWSAITEARIDMPASTATVTQDLITDLRVQANPTSEYGFEIAEHDGAAQSMDSSTYVDFPAFAQWTIDIPTWATGVEAAVAVYGINFDGDQFGFFRIGLGDAHSGLDIRFDLNYTGGPGWESFTHAAVVQGDLPAGYAGTSRVLKVQARRSTSSIETGTLFSADGTAAVAQYMFYQRPITNL